MEIIRPTFSQSQDDPNQLVYQLPQKYGRGVVSGKRFSSGLILAYMDLHPIRPITLSYETTGWSSGISFNLTGSATMHSSEHRLSFSAKSGTSPYFVFPEPHTLEEEIGLSRRTKVSIMFDLNTLIDFANNDEEPFRPFLKGLENQASILGQEMITPEIKRGLNQLVACPYAGKTRSLFLEGKTMEIFAQRLEQMRGKDKSSLRQPRINKTDIERIHYAAELLVCDPVNPPDLTELAGKTGMSRSKFYQIFKLVFGHSPMNHLCSHRLQAARQLLRQGGYNVAEAAFAVGFNNPSYFAKAFAAEFGISPHQAI